MRRNRIPITTLAGFLFFSLMVVASPARVAGEEQLRLALDGFDPVAYFTEGRPVPGKPDIEVAFDEVRYRFASPENLAQFRLDPDRYLPRFNGICAMGLGAKGYKVVANPNNWTIHEGRLFVTQSAVGLKYFNKDPERWASAANVHAGALKDVPIGSGLSWW